MRCSSILTITAALALALPALAKPAYVPKAQKAGITDAKCVTCHIKMGSKDLNELGTFAKSTEKGGEPDFAAVAKHAKK